MALQKQKRIQQLQELGLNQELSVYLETGDENALNQFQMEQEELAEAVKEFTLSDFPLQENLKLTENPLRNNACRICEPNSFFSTEKTVFMTKINE